MTNSVPNDFAQRDATVWRAEVEARGHEKVFVQLADALRSASDKGSVLAKIQFQQLTLPARDGIPVGLALGIQRQNFNERRSFKLAHAEWGRALEQFRAAGWALVQVEWRHEQFSPATANASASSEFGFELHGEQLNETNRFIIRGALSVGWAKRGVGGASPAMQQLAVKDLVLLERQGPPGFSHHALIAPEPDRAGGQVNLHPLVVADLNGDRHDDIVLGGANKALLNNGHANFRTVDFIAPGNFYPLKEAGVFADFDGDGVRDFLGVPAMGPLMKRLVMYRGTGRIPINAAAGTAWVDENGPAGGDELAAASAMTAGDIDEDGDLDVFVAQYRPPFVGGNLPTPYYDANDGHPARLLINDGAGRFHAASNQAALQDKGRRRTLAASFADLDHDGDLDLITLNDFSGVDLFFNDGMGMFTDETWRLSNPHLFGMGHCLADFDLDGFTDLLAIGMDVPTVRRLERLGLAPREHPERTAKRGSMTFGNRLYLGPGKDGHWHEPLWAQAVARTGWSWGVSAADFDCDGRLDIYVANGHVSGASGADYDSYYWTRDIYFGTSGDDPAAGRYFSRVLHGLNTGATSWNGYQHNALFVDVGSNDYVNVAWLMGVAHETDCRAVVTADLNEDGRPDLLVTGAKWQGSPNNMKHELYVHLNQLPPTNHWIGLRLGDTQRALGAKVFLLTRNGERAAQVITGDSFQSQHPASVHFGLGSEIGVQTIRVVWADGKTNVIKRPAIDHWHTLAP